MYNILKQEWHNYTIYWYRNNIILKDINTGKQAEAEVVPSSSLVKVMTMQVKLS